MPQRLRNGSRVRELRGKEKPVEDIVVPRLAQIDDGASADTREPEAQGRRLSATGVVLTAPIQATGTGVTGAGGAVAAGARLLCMHSALMVRGPGIP